MACKDLALTKDGDLYIGPDGDFKVIDSIRQAIQIKLRWIRGEWCFNKATGTPYMESILVKNPNRAIVEKAIRDQILSVDGVDSIGSISFSVDSKNHLMRCSFIANTTYGEIESEVNLSIG